jgi:hypothetical protein
MSCVAMLCYAVLCCVSEFVCSLPASVVGHLPTDCDVLLTEQLPLYRQLLSIQTETGREKGRGREIERETSGPQGGQRVRPNPPSSTSDPPLRQRTLPLLLPLPLLRGSAHRQPAPVPLLMRLPHPLSVLRPPQRRRRRARRRRRGRARKQKEW